MPKSETQAQKREKREAKIKEQEERRAEEKRARDLEFQKQAKQARETQQSQLSTKEKRDLKKAQKKSEQDPVSLIANLTLLDDPDSDGNLPQLSRSVDSQGDGGSQPDKILLDGYDELANADSLKTKDDEQVSVLSSSSALAYPPPADVLDLDRSAASGSSVSTSSYQAIIKRTDQSIAQRISTETDNTNSDPSRIVQNHSTYCEGLRPVLVRLEKLLSGCTITPGELSQVQTKQECFSLELQREKNSHSYKLVARKGKTAQDVFISVSDTKIYTEEVIREALLTAQENRSISEKASTDSDIRISYLNHEIARQKERTWTTDHQQKDQERKAKERAARERQAIKEQERKLASKEVSADQRHEYAIRDAAIISGESRTKHSMKK